MRSTYSRQRSRMAPFRESRSIDIDGSRIFEIEDEPSAIEQIILQPENEPNRSLRNKHLNGPEKLKSATIINRRLNEYVKGKKQEPVLETEVRIRGGEKRNAVEEFRERFLRMLKHIVQIRTSSGKNKIPSENIYNLFQQRRSLEGKLGEGVLILKHLFEMEYTNKLSLMAEFIIQRQRRYEIYGEPEELQKVLNLIYDEIDHMASTYFHHEEQKMHLLYSEDLLREISLVKIKNYRPITEKQPIQKEKEVYSPQEKQGLESIDMIQEIIMQKKQSNQCANEGNQTDSENRNEKQEMIQSSSERVHFELQIGKNDANLILNPIENEQCSQGQEQQFQCQNEAQSNQLISPMQEGEMSPQNEQKDEIQEKKLIFEEIIVEKDREID